MDAVVRVPARTATLTVEPFAIAHCATCHVTRNLAASDPLTGDAIRSFRAVHAAQAGHRVTLRFL